MRKKIFSILLSLAMVITMMPAMSMTSFATRNSNVPVSILRAYTGGKVGKKAVKLVWNKVPGAKKYVIYGAKCGNKYKKLKTVTGTKYTVKKIGKKKLKAHRTYKFYVVAYNKYGKKLVSSKRIHFITANTRGKYANVKSIKAEKTKATVGVGKTVTLKATKKMYKNRKHIRKAHGTATRYITNNPEVVTVSKDGVVRGKSVGTATIYIQDIGGRYCKTVITVKENTDSNYYQIGDKKYNLQSCGYYYDSYEDGYDILLTADKLDLSTALSTDPIKYVAIDLPGKDLNKLCEIKNITDTGWFFYFAFTDDGYDNEISCGRDLVNSGGTLFVNIDKTKGTVKVTIDAVLNDGSNTVLKCNYEGPVVQSDSFLWEEWD